MPGSRRETHLTSAWQALCSSLRDQRSGPHQTRCANAASVTWPAHLCSCHSSVLLVCIVPGRQQRWHKAQQQERNLAAGHPAKKGQWWTRWRLRMWGLIGVGWLLCIQLKAACPRDHIHMSDAHSLPQRPHSLSLMLTSTITLINYPNSSWDRHHGLDSLLIQLTLPTPCSHPCSPPMLTSTHTIVSISYSHSSQDPAHTAPTVELTKMGLSADQGTVYSWACIHAGFIA